MRLGARSGVCVCTVQVCVWMSIKLITNARFEGNNNLELMIHGTYIYVCEGVWMQRAKAPRLHTTCPSFVRSFVFVCSVDVFGKYFVHNYDFRVCVSERMCMQRRSNVTRVVPFDFTRDSGRVQRLSTTIYEFEYTSDVKCYPLSS